MTTTTTMVGFSICGDWLTQRVREMVLSDKWRAALSLLIDDMEGMTYDIAVSILRGEKKLAGIDGYGQAGITLNDEDPDDEDTNSYKQDLKLQHEHKINVRGMWYEPEYVVTSYGTRDSLGPATYRSMHRVCPDYYDPPNKNDYETRAKHYSENPDKALTSVVEIPWGYFEHEKKNQFISLWKIVPEPPSFMEAKFDSMCMDKKFQQCFNTFLRNGNIAEETGHRIVYMGLYDALHGDMGPEDLITSYDKINDISPAENPVSSITKMANKLYAEPEQYAPKHTSSLESKHGVILRDGRFFACDYLGHGNLCYRIMKFIYEEEFEDARKSLDDKGAIHCGTSLLLGGEVEYQFPEFGYRMPSPQLRTLADWCIHHGVEMNKDDF